MNQEKRLISSKDLFSAIEELLAENRQAVFTVTGMSMWPFLCHGRDSVIVESCQNVKIKKGDIILFQTPLKNYVLHRITSLKDDRFETTGDGNCHRDGWYDCSCIKARVVKMVRKGKTIDCNHIFWKSLAFLWTILFPIRRVLLKLCLEIGKVKNKKRNPAE